MSGPPDLDNDDLWDDSEDPPPPPPEDDEPEVISNRGKLQERVNPLQLKMMEDARKAEERRTREEKEAKLAAKLAAFGGGFTWGASYIRWAYDVENRKKG